MFNSILVVCTGNICRSPYGEYKLRSELPCLSIASAGVAVKTSRLQNRPADSSTISVANEFGVDVSRHKARQLTQEMVDEHDLILCMEPDQLEIVCDSFKEARHKSFLFGHWVGLGKIDDPYQQGEHAFREAFSNINRATHAWVKRLNI